MKPLSKSMEGILITMHEMDRKAGLPQDDHKPNAIAHQMISKGRLSGEAIQGGTGQGGRGKGHRTFNPAQRLITPLGALAKRGLVKKAWKDGPAYYLSDTGYPLAKRLASDA